MFLFNGNLATPVYEIDQSEIFCMETIHFLFNTLLVTKNFSVGFGLGILLVSTGYSNILSIIKIIPAYYVQHEISDIYSSYILDNPVIREIIYPKLIVTSKIEININTYFIEKASRFREFYNNNGSMV